MYDATGEFSQGLYLLTSIAVGLSMAALILPQLSRPKVIREEGIV